MNPSNSNMNISCPDMKLNINSGILTLLNQTIISSLTDFNGLLLAKYKKQQQIQSIDSNANYASNTLNIIIDDVILFFDKQYLIDSHDRIIQNIHSQYNDSVIIGFCSGKAYSFPKMSLNDQELYFKLYGLLRSSSSFNNKLYLSLPFLFGTFAHNSSNTNESDINGIKNINFQSKFYYYDCNKNIFSSLTYSILNIKETTYLNIIDPLSNKIENKKLFRDNDQKKEKNMLKELLDSQLKEIETTQSKQIKELKLLLKNEIGEYLTLSKQLKSFNK